MLAAAAATRLAARHPLRAGALRGVAVPTPSAVVAAPRRDAERRRGRGAAERGRRQLLVPKRRSAHATCALAVTP